MEEYYRHFKGNLYRVLHIAKHSETLEEMVVYQAMYGERAIWVRPQTMFEEVIERNGKTFRRFEPISAEDANDNHIGFQCSERESHLFGEDI